MFSFSTVPSSLLVTLLSVVITVQAANQETKKPLIDFLTLDYLSVEQAIWSKIDPHYDKATMFSMLRRDHERFLMADFGATDILRSEYVPSARILIDNLKLVNSLFHNASLLLRSNDIGFDDVVRAFEHGILSNADRFSEEIFREASRAEFWEKGKNYLQFCRESKASLITIESEFQLIFNYYKDIRAALLKGYILTQLSHMLTSISNKGNQLYHLQTPLIIKNEFNQRNEFIKRNVKNLLRISKRDSWICDSDPKAHDFDYYEQLTNFLQGYIDNELNFNGEDTCTKNCDDYKIAKNVKCAAKTMCGTLNNDGWTEKAVCAGEIHDCIEIDSNDVTVCHAKGPNRRYDHVSYIEGQTYGLEPFPDRQCVGVGHAKSWRRWFVKCSSCYCLCDDLRNSDRHFSLHEVVSDVEQNKVVTGIRIIKPLGVVQFAISQRTLLPFGQTDASEKNTWKSASYQFSINDRGPIDGIDYYTLTYANRSINLDDLLVPPGKVVTGVRFHHLNGHILLQIRATDFDYFSGRLENISYNPWVMNANGGQYEIEITKRNNPIDAGNELNVPNRLPNTYVTFGPSDFETDLGQLTVPFIESISLESKNPMVLSGIGLCHKSQPDSGGFIAPKLITYDFPIADPITDEEYDYIE